MDRAKVAWSGIDWGLEGGDDTSFVEIDENGHVINKVDCHQGDCQRNRLGAEPCTFCPFNK